MLQEIIAPAETVPANTKFMPVNMIVTVIRFIRVEFAFDEIMVVFAATTGVVYA